MQYFRSIFFHLFPLKKVKIGKLKLNRLVDMAAEEEAGVVSDVDGAVEIEGEGVVEIKTMIDFSVITLILTAIRTSTCENSPTVSQKWVENFPIRDELRSTFSVHDWNQPISNPTIEFIPLLESIV